VGVYARRAAAQLALVHGLAIEFSY